MDERTATALLQKHGSLFGNALKAWAAIQRIGFGIAEGHSAFEITQSLCRDGGLSAPVAGALVQDAFARVITEPDE